MNDTNNKPRIPIGFPPKSEIDLIEVLGNSPELASKYSELSELAKITYLGWLEMDFLAVLAIRDSEIISRIERESPELKDKLFQTIETIKKSQYLRYELKLAVPMAKGVLDSVYDGINIDTYMHRSTINRKALEEAGICGCYHCGKIFPYTKEIPEEYFVDNGQTLICPYCGIDSVIPPTTDIPFNKETLFVIGDRAFAGYCSNESACIKAILEQKPIE